MKKTLKWLAAILAVGTTVGVIIAYFCKGTKNEEEDFRFDCDDDEFDLDSDLQPVSERGYVSLKKTAEAEVSETEETEETEDAEAESTESIVPETAESETETTEEISTK